MEEKFCLYCTNKLRGRTDKRFCNDDCRNKFNRNKRQEEKRSETQNIPSILNILKQNYLALKKREPIKVEGYMFSMEGIKMSQINPKFFTSIAHVDQSTWYCCFDYCWQKRGDEYCEVRRFPDQADFK
jgi:predicted nucleic acid-binding Zn ribbon protein